MPTKLSACPTRSIHKFPARRHAASARDLLSADEISRDEHRVSGQVFGKGLWARSLGMVLGARSWAQNLGSYVFEAELLRKIPEVKVLESIF
jgi:hypothetical protein